jgi:hypothetical protein
LLFWSSQFKPTQVALDLKVGLNCSTPLNSTGRSNIFFANQTTNFIVSYKYSQFMLRLNSNNQFVLLYFYDNKKQTTFVNSSCHYKPNVNHLHLTLTYTSYFLLLLFITKYYKLAVYAGGDSVKSDQT